MADGDREYIGGWLAIEVPAWPWDRGTFDKDTKIVMCGELGHVRWLLFQLAARAAARHVLDSQLAEMAQRVGVKYSSTQRRTTAHNDETEHKP